MYIYKINLSYIKSILYLTMFLSGRHKKKQFGDKYEILKNVMENY